MGNAEYRSTDQPIRHSSPGRYTLRFDIQQREPSTMTVLAVAEVDGTPYEAMEPLRNHIDPTGLDALFEPRADGSVPSDVAVTFRYEGYEVRIESQGLIVLTPA